MKTLQQYRNLVEEVVKVSGLEYSKPNWTNEQVDVPRTTCYKPESRSTSSGLDQFYFCDFKQRLQGVSTISAAGFCIWTGY